MKCPTCNAWTRVLETRNDYRKRECGNLHRFWTVESIAEDKTAKAEAYRAHHENYIKRKLKT